MTTTLFNPTNEDLTGCHGGVNFTIKKYPEKGHKVTMDDARAKHLLNTLQQRGLTYLEYGDELDDGQKEKQKADDGIQRNLDFKRRQVMRYNQENEARKAQQLSYVHPPDHIDKYAKEVGTGLIQPYAVQDAKNEEISELKGTNAELMKQLLEQSKKMEGMFNLLRDKGMLMNEEETKQHELEQFREEYIHMKPAEFGPFVYNLGVEKFRELSIPIQQDIRAKWARFFEDGEKDDKKEPFPY